MQYLPDPALTLPEVFVLRAAREPDAEILRLVSFSGGEPVAQPYTNRQLLMLTQAAALALQENGLGAGDRAVLSVSNAAEFLSLFLGAQCLGAIPVPVPSSNDLPARGFAARLGAVVRDAKPRLVVVEDAAAMEAQLPELPRTLAIRGVQECCRPAGTSKAGAALKPLCHSNDVAFLQYTSGTTGVPKGVVVLHANVIANLRAIIDGANVGLADVTYSWLPLFHDMGLVAGLLLGIYLGIPTYVAHPRSFINHPASWLRAVCTFGATFSFGPNFAFDILAQKVPRSALDKLDLSRWRLAFDGAEVVDPRTVEAFLQRYAPYGFAKESFRPAYGLAECTLAAAFLRPGQMVQVDYVDRAGVAECGVAIPGSPEAPTSIGFTTVGTPVPGHRIRIVDVDAQRELPERQLGEIVISGPSVSPGYFAELAAGSMRCSELRTGDLGYIADGHLYVVDRLKDVLIVAGRKYSPANIELLVGRIPGIRQGAVVAFSTRGDCGTEDVYVVAGLEAGSTQMKNELLRMIRCTLREHVGLSPAEVFLVRPGMIPRTSSGKVMRSACIGMLRAGRFQREGLCTG